MWMPWPDINNMDLLHQNPAIERNKQSWNNEFQRALKWLKIEIPKTIEEQEKEVYDIIINKTFADEIKGWEWKKEDIIIKYIKPWVFTFINNKTWNVNYFIDWKWEIILALWGLEKNRIFIGKWKSLEFAWYKQKVEDWKYNMYKVIWTRKNWEEVLDWPININSPDYYEAWKNILFFDDMLNKYAFLKIWRNLDKESIEVFIEWWSFKFEDLEIFRQKWLITPEDFNYWIQEMRKVLVSQCGDPRLINLKWLDWKTSWIKESDLKKYMENKEYWISPELALECYKALAKEMRDLSEK